MNPIAMSLLIAWSAQGQDKGLLVRVEPLFPEERYYGERFWMKIIYKNISNDSLFFGSTLSWFGCSDILWSTRAMDLAILNEKGKNVRGIWIIIDEFHQGMFGHEKPPDGWTKERLRDTWKYTLLLPGDSIIRLLNLVDFIGLKPATYTFDELKIDYSWVYGNWTGFWNGKIEIENIGYRFTVEDRGYKFKKEEKYGHTRLLVKDDKILVLLSGVDFLLKWGEKGIDTFEEAYEELLRVMKKEDTNSFLVFYVLDRATSLYAEEKVKSHYDASDERNLHAIRIAIAKADAIEFLIQDLKAKGYDSEFFRADYWFWLYYYRRTHIGKLGGEK